MPQVLATRTVDTVPSIYWRDDVLIRREASRHSEAGKIAARSIRTTLLGRCRLPGQ
jgi:hypothetical protein